MTLLVNPPARWGAAIAELPTSNKAILFGGKTPGAYLSDTYTWNGTAWVLVNTPGPSARSDASMAYDGTNVVLACGTDGNSNLSDTWHFNGTVWAQEAITDAISPPNNYTAPTTLRGAAMAYQSGISGGEAVLFGGIASFQRHYVQDTWILAHGTPDTWTLLSPAALPSGRVYSAMASNATVAVLFGGKNFDGGLSDTYKWNGTNFSLVATGQIPGTSSPSARYGSSMIYDAAHSNYVLFGGITSSNEYSNETWTFSTGTNIWTKVAGNSPPARAFASMFYLTATSNAVLFGGLGPDRFFGDTWVYNGSWTQQ